MSDYKIWISLSEGIKSLSNKVQLDIRRKTERMVAIGFVSGTGTIEGYAYRWYSDLYKLSADLLVYIDLVDEPERTLDE